MKVLVCGDRDWIDSEYLELHLDELHKVNNFTLLIEGECRGVDIMSRNWADHNGIPAKKFPADWKKYKNAAGPIRNKAMLAEKPDLVVAFHPNIKESKGTKHMVSIARITTHVIIYDGNESGYYKGLCCENEQRSMAGGCTNCGAPSI